MNLPVVAQPAANEIGLVGGLLLRALGSPTDLGFVAAGGLAAWIVPLHGWRSLLWIAQLRRSRSPFRVYLSARVARLSGAHKCQTREHTEANANSFSRAPGLPRAR